MPPPLTISCRNSLCGLEPVNHFHDILEEEAISFNPKRMTPRALLVHSGKRVPFQSFARSAGDVRHLGLETEPFRNLRRVNVGMFDEEPHRISKRLPYSLIQFVLVI